MTFSNRLPPLLLASAVGLFLPLFALEHQASACGATTELPPPGYVSVANPSPADGAKGVPIDAAVGVEILLNSGAFAADPSLILRDLATGEAVPGTVGSAYFQSPMLRFKPSERLTPNHEYAIEVAVTQTLKRPADAKGVEELRTTFTTGDSAAPALKVVGMLEVALEAAESPVYGSCFCGSCVPAGTVSTTSAQLSLPGVTGGDASHGYQLRVVVTADVPFEFEQVATPKGADAGSPDEVQLEFLELVGEKPGTQASIGPLHRGREYSPCFAIEATDFFGNTAIGEPLCIKDRVPLVG
ncbi:MAG: hypothetical protein RJA70_2228, partial [Pseudomonadota bacterium]